MQSERGKTPEAPSADLFGFSWEIITITEASVVTRNKQRNIHLQYWLPFCQIFSPFIPIGFPTQQHLGPCPTTSSTALKIVPIDQSAMKLETLLLRLFSDSPDSTWRVGVFFIPLRCRWRRARDTRRATRSTRWHVVH